MVVYSFPPVKDAGSKRSAEFVRQLPSCGWDPIVLTRALRTQYEADPKIAVPKGIDIIRTRPWEPENLPHFLHSAGNGLSSLLIPDEERLWELFAVRKAIRLVKNNGVDLIYTVSPPSSAHIIGLRLKKKYPSIPWVADICKRAPNNKKKIKDHYEQKLERRIIHGADCVISGNKAVYEGLQTLPADSSLPEACSYVSDGNVQLLSEQFEKACRAIAAKKISNGSNES